MARLAEVYLPGVLYVVFVGAIISAILSVVHSALHAPAAQISHNIVDAAGSRPQRSRQAVVRAPDRDGAERRRLRDLVQLRGHPGAGRDGLGVRQCRRVRRHAVCAVHALWRTAQRLRVDRRGHAGVGRRQVRAWGSPRPICSACWRRWSATSVWPCSSSGADNSPLTNVRPRRAEHCLADACCGPAMCCGHVSRTHRHATVARQCQPRRVYCAAHEALAAPSVRQAIYRCNR